MTSSHLCCPLLLLLSVLLRIRGFSNELVLLIKWPKFWSFSFSISPSNEYSGFISFSVDWLDLLAVQGTLKSLLQHYSSKTPTLRCSAFFMVQLSHPYVTPGKTIALTTWTFVMDLYPWGMFQGLCGWLKSLILPNPTCNMCFSHTYIFMIRHTLQIRHSKRLTTTKNKIENYNNTM